MTWREGAIFVRNTRLKARSNCLWPDVRAIVIDLAGAISIRTKIRLLGKLRSHALKMLYSRDTKSVNIKLTR